MAIEKRQPHEYEFDIGRFWDKKVVFYSLAISKPPFSRTIDPASLGLAFATQDKNVKAITNQTAKFLCLPKDRHAKFEKRANRIRGILAGYRLDGFPFISQQTVPVNRNNENAMLAALDVEYQGWLEDREQLALDLPAIRDRQHDRAKKAAEAIYAKNSTIMESEDKFVRRFLAVFHDRFPSQQEIRTSYDIRLKNLGSIRKSVCLMTQTEIVNDAETKAKLAVVAAGEQAAIDEVKDFFAGQAAMVRCELFKALWPIVDDFKSKRAMITPARAARFAKKIDKLKNVEIMFQNLHIFKDATFGQFAEEVKKVLKSASDESANALDKVYAQMKLDEALGTVQKSIQTMRLDPEDFRDIDVGGEAGAIPVFANAELCAELSERMRAEAEKAAKECAEKVGGTPEEKWNAERRARKALNLADIAKKAADDGMAAADIETVIATGERFLGVMDELDPETAPGTKDIEPMAPMAEAVPLALELDEAGVSDALLAGSGLSDADEQAIGSRFANLEL